MRKKSNKAFDFLTDDKKTRKVFSVGTYAVLCIVSLVMTIMNIYTNKGFLTICTGAFSALCALNLIFTLINDVLAVIGRVFFAIEVTAMFTFFLVSGIPEGFSAIWICMLPSLGMLFFNKYVCSALCTAMFAILAFLLWSPSGNEYLMYEYTDTFKMRFPVLFVAFFFVAFLLETLRSNAYKERDKLREYYHDLSMRDQLTGMFNRQGMYSMIENGDIFANASNVGVAMFDIDFFKKVNDTYGHRMGDEVLQQFAEFLRETLNAVSCRWGGEEFVAVFLKDSVESKDIEQLKEKMQNHKFSTGTKLFSVTVSCGIANTDKFKPEKLDELIEMADNALYKAKNAGRNKIVYY